MGKQILKIIEIFFALASTNVWAQTLGEGEMGVIVPVPSDAQLFLGLVGGVLLGIAFHMILTNLSIGLGLSSIEEEPDPKPDPPGGKGNLVRKITIGFGVLTFIVTCLAMFCSSWLGIRLSQTTQADVGITLGLSIWAATYLLMVAFETYASASLVGTLWFRARGTQSEEDVGRKIAAASEDFRDRIKTYVQQLSPSAAVRAEERRHFSKEEMNNMRGRLERALQSSGKEELQSETLKRDLQGPSSAIDILRSRLASIDKSTVASIVAQRKDLSPQEAQQTVERVSSIITELRSQFNDRRQQVAQDASDVSSDVKRLFSDPKMEADMLLVQLKSLNRESLKQIISARTDLSPQEIEQHLQIIESERDEAIDKAQLLKTKIQLRREETRKTMVIASWWAVTVAVCSGLAAAFGGWLAVIK